MQADILDYIRNGSFVGLDWPDRYWPADDATATPEEWTATIDAFLDDAGALRAIVSDPATDLTATIPGTSGHTILREIRVVGDHNAYHIRVFASLRQVMGTWPDDRSA